MRTCKKGLCILVNNVAAGILENIANALAETFARRLNHKGLDLNCVQSFYHLAAEKHVGP